MKYIKSTPESPSKISENIAFIISYEAKLTWSQVGYVVSSTYVIMKTRHERKVLMWLSDKSHEKTGESFL